jgi:hypothetical protein
VIGQNQTLSINSSTPSITPPPQSSSSDLLRKLEELEKQVLNLRSQIEENRNGNETWTADNSTQPSAPIIIVSNNYTGFQVATGKIIYFFKKLI